MRLITGPSPGPVDVGGLAAAYPWPGHFWVRAMMVMTLDGASAGPDGRSGSISASADRLVFAEVRRLSEVVLIGAGTFRAERYQPMVAKLADAAERESLGLAPATVVAIVSASLDLPWEEPIFTRSTIRPLVITTEQAHPDRLAIAREHSDVLLLPGPDVDPALLMDRLAERGYRRIVCEGGPRLLSDLIARQLVDEADLSISPLMAGPGRWLTGPPYPQPAAFTLQHVLSDGDFLFTRYLAPPRASSKEHP
jgi:riboflavin biosynthesis pyrimidine reductase